MRAWRFAGNGLKLEQGGWGEDLGHGQGEAFLRGAGSRADCGPGPELQWKDHLRSGGLAPLFTNHVTLGQPLARVSYVGRAW